MADVVLAIDQGTTNSKAILARGTDVIAIGSAPVRLSLPRPGWFEQDANDIWYSVLQAASDAVSQCPGERISAIAISNQRESVVAWDRRTGEPLGPVLGWQDARTAGECAGLAAAGLGEEVAALTGLRLDPMFSAPKMRWLLDAISQAGKSLSNVGIGTIDAFLVARLTGGASYVTEASNASRTTLLDLASLTWSAGLCEAFGVPLGLLPDVVPSNAPFGTSVAAGPIPAGVPIAAVLGDSHAALFGHGCSRPGMAKVTYGTGSSIMTPVASRTVAASGVATTLAWWVGEPLYAQEGNIIATGAALDTVSRLMNLGSVAELSELAATAQGSGGLSVVPAFSGLGAPYWDRRAAGLICGLARESNAGQLARAALESVAHQIADVIDAIEAGGQQVTDLYADGGPSANPLLMQISARLVGRPITAARRAEVSALGVAALAQGITPVPDAGGVRYEPAGTHEQRAAARNTWKAAVARSRAAIDDEGREG